MKTINIEQVIKTLTENEEEYEDTNLVYGISDERWDELTDDMTEHLQLGVIEQSNSYSFLAKIALERAVVVCRTSEEAVFYITHAFRSVAQSVSFP